VRDRKEPQRVLTKSSRARAPVYPRKGTVDFCASLSRLAVLRFNLKDHLMNKTNKAISAYTQPSGHIAFTPERPETADEGMIGPTGKKHDTRTGHIKRGGAMSPTAPSKK
jgi:hypothetical protein